MNIYTNSNSAFPSQVVSEAEKSSLEYGSQVAMAIEYEWFRSGRTNGNRYLTNWNNFHELRLYARGEQSTPKVCFKLSIYSLASISSYIFEAYLVLFFTDSGS